MLFTIKNVSIEDRPAKGRGQPYQMAEIIYDDGRGIKTYKMASFSNPQVFTTIKNAKGGEQYDVTVVKGDDGYNKWTSANPAGGASSGPTAPSQAGAPGRSSSPQVNNYGRDFESKEERTVKQRLIVKQSSLAVAAANLAVGAKAPPELDKVLEAADKLVAWVYDAPGLDTTPLQDIPDDIPY
jgi:hypothetical protein